MEEISKEFERLLLQDPDQTTPEIRIAEINTFIDQFSKAPEFSTNKASVYFMRAEALFELQQYEEALQVYKDVLELKPPSIDLVSIQRISEVLAKLDQAPEAKSFLTDAIKKQLIPDYKLNLLYCYVNLFGETADEMSPFQEDIHATIKELGIDVPENMGLNELVVYSKKQKQAASRRFGELTLRIRDMTAAEKQNALRNFIAGERIGYVIKLAEDYLQYLEKNIVKF